MHHMPHRAAPGQPPHSTMTLMHHLPHRAAPGQPPPSTMTLMHRMPHRATPGQPPPSTMTLMHRMPHRAAPGQPPYGTMTLHPYLYIYHALSISYPFPKTTYNRSWTSTIRMHQPYLACHPCLVLLVTRLHASANLPALLLCRPHLQDHLSRFGAHASYTLCSSCSIPNGPALSPLLILYLFLCGTALLFLTFPLHYPTHVSPEILSFRNSRKTNPTFSVAV